MLVYLDNSQFAWLEGLEDSLQAEFVSEWRALGCELALSLEILQEVHKRGDEESISKRVETLLSLAPLRGMPAGSAGVMVREVTDQVRQLLGTAVADPVAGGRAALFPHMSPTTLRETLAENSDHLSRFDVIGQAQAELQSNAHGLPPVKKGTRVDVVAMEEFIRTKQRELLAGLPRNIATEMVRELGDRAIDAVKATEGDLWRANLVRLGISQLGCLRDLNAEDYSKAAGFVEMAREYAADIAEGAGRRLANAAGKNHHQIALGSAAEACAVLDLVNTLPGAPEHQQKLRRIGAMLAKLSR